MDWQPRLWIRVEQVIEYANSSWLKLRKKFWVRELETAGTRQELAQILTLEWRVTSEHSMEDST